MMDIPEEAVIEILLRLPVKSLLIFQCVCKTWRALIRSPSFIDMHFNHPSQNNRTDYLLLNRSELFNNANVMSFYTRDDDDGSLCMAAPDFPAYSHPALGITGPCNGIVCLSDLLVDFSDSVLHQFLHREYGRVVGAIYLCNPATRESRRLPDRPFGFPHGFTCHRYGVGFGFDSFINDYKVVSIFMLRDKVCRENDYGICKIEIYNLNSNSWREADIILPDAISPPGFVHSEYIQVCQTGLYFKGSFHWPTYECGNDMILCFDMCNEVLRVLLSPFAHIPPEKKVRLYASLLVLEDSLASIDILYEDETSLYQDITSISIWVMMEYGVNESWIKRFSLGPFIGAPLPLTCWNDDKLFLQIDRNLVSCDLLEDNHQLRKYNINGYDGRGSLEAIVFYKESLISLR